MQFSPISVSLSADVADEWNMFAKLFGKQLVKKSSRNRCLQFHFMIYWTPEYYSQLENCTSLQTPVANKMK